jgi:hypothetical protein
MIYFHLNLLELEQIFCWQGSLWFDRTGYAFDKYHYHKHKNGYIISIPRDYPAPSDEFINIVP